MKVYQITSSLTPRPLSPKRGEGEPRIWALAFAVEQGNRW